MRARFDAEVRFSNGGSLTAEAFRLDVPGDDIDDAALGEAFVHHLGLLMVEQVTIRNKTLFREAHKGSRGVAAAATSEWRRVVDLSHPIHHGMITYPGLPGPEVSDHLSREASRAVYPAGTEFHIGRISMVANTGTYLDVPSHRFPDGTDLAATGVSHFADLKGLVLRVGGSASRQIDREALLALDVRGCAVLLHTGWDRHFGTERYATDAPFLTARGAAWLAEQGAALVGIDSVNIDDMGDRTRPAHTALLRAGIPIVEHLRGLEQLPPVGFRFHAAPPPVTGMGTFTVRAYAVIGA